MIQAILILIIRAVIRRHLLLSPVVRKNSLLTPLDDISSTCDNTDNTYEGICSRL